MTEMVNAPPAAAAAELFPLRKRRRPALSCEQCRRRKIKCSRGQPCEQCSQAHKTACTYTPSAPTKVYLQSKAETVYTPLLEQAFSKSLPIHVGPRLSQSAATSTTQSPPNTNIFETTVASTAGTSPNADWKSDASSTKVQPLLDRIQRLERLLAESSSKSEALITPPYFNDSGENGLGGSLSKTRYFGPTNWMYSFSQLDVFNWGKDRPSFQAHGFKCDINGVDAMTLLDQCKALGRAAKRAIYNEYLKNPNVQDLVPSRELADALIDIYFRTCESHYRILHYPSFNREYIQYWEQPATATDSFLLKMLLAMAMAVTYYQGSDVIQVQALAKKWILAGSQWLSVLPSEKSRLSISGLQVNCLLILARQTHGVVGDMAWISAGNLVRAAMHMGFNRDPKYFPKMSWLHAELRRRLWATILEIVVQSSLDIGMIPLLATDDFDTEPPANINDCDIDEATRDQPISKPSNVYTQTTLQIILLKSLSLRLRICRYLNHFRTISKYDEVLELGAQMTTACKDSIVTILAARSQDPSIKVSQLQRNLSDQYIRRFLMTLHLAYALKAQSNPRFYYSRKVCLDCAVIMSNYPTNEEGTNSAPLAQLPRDDFTQYKLFYAAYFKSVKLHTLLIIFCEIMQQIEESSPSPGIDRLSREPLKVILKEATDITLHRIGISESNVKGHLFLSAIQGQIESLENGEPAEVGIVAGAMKSAKICLELLSTRLPRPASNEDGFVTEGASGSDGATTQAHNTEWRTAPGDPTLAPANGNGEMMEFGMGDWNMDFEVPDSWLFAGWEEDKCW